MNRFRTLAMMAACTAALSPLSQVHAVGDDVDVDATAKFRAALVLTKQADIGFTNGAGVYVDLAGVSDSSVLTLGTDGTLGAAGGTYFINVPATGIPGEVDIAGTAGQVIEINCSTTASMAPSAGDPIDLENIQFSTAAAGGSPAACPGVLPAVPVAYTLGAGTDTILLGGDIAADGGGVGLGVQPLDYSTATAPGTPVNVEVNYQ